MRQKPCKAALVSGQSVAAPDKTGLGANHRLAGRLVSPEIAALRVIAALDGDGESAWGEYADYPALLAELQRRGRVAASGATSQAETMLASQAEALQTMFARLTERAMEQDAWPHFEGFMRLALKAQAQSRLCLEALLAARQAPGVFAQQVNLANGPQQVNNAPR